MDISVVIPLFNEEESLKELHNWIASMMQSNRFLYEIIFIDDGSTDSSWQVIEEISKKLWKITGITCWLSNCSWKRSDYYGC